MAEGGQHQAPAAFTPRKDPVPIVQKAGWASESVWIGAENLAPTGFRSPDFPGRSESLYRLRHPDSNFIRINYKFYNLIFRYYGHRNRDGMPVL